MSPNRIVALATRIGSVGEWLKARVSKTALASYVGPILLEEGLAKRGRGPDLIHF
jgi:hypothetical protein